MKRFSVSLMIIITLLFVMTVPVFSQINWMSPLHKPGISLEVTKVDFPTSDYWYISKSSSIEYDLSARVKLVNGFYLLCEVPFVQSSGYFIERSYGSGLPNYFKYNFNESSWGNPLIGLEVNEGNNGFLVRFSTRLPLADNEKYYARYFGRISAYDRWEAFSSNIITCYLDFGHIFAIPDHFQSRILLGSMLIKPKSWNIDLYESLSTELWGDWRHFKAGVGYHAQYLITADNYSFDRRFEHQIGFYCALSIGRIHPGIHLRMPLDKSLREIVNFSYGLNLTVDLPQ
jgi:hypothetical protein